MMLYHDDSRFHIDQSSLKQGYEMDQIGEEAKNPIG
jgi:hypothetical protein